MSAPQQDLPSFAPVVVIGGGVMGCSTLYHLARDGVSDAILLERNQLTSGTTWHSAAQVRALRSSRNLTELIRYSIDLYAELEAETGQATGWINRGSLSIATTTDRLTHIQRQAQLARIYGVEATMIDPGEAAERWPLMRADDVIGAVWSPGDGRVSPSDLCAALAKGARSRGARLFEETPVSGLVTEGGRIVGVETARGLVRCEKVVVTTGLWSREIAGMAGVDAPLWPCEHFYLLTKPVPGAEGNLPTLSDHDAHLYIRDDSGGLLVGCFEPMGKAIDPDRLGPDFAFQLLPEDWDHFEPMMAGALHRLPALESAEVRMLLNGPESFTPDGMFLLGEAPGVRGLFLGCGMNSVGVATGGGAGMALARAVVDGEMPFDLGEAHPARFSPDLWSARALAERVPEVLGKHYEIAYPGRQWSTARGLRAHPLREAFAQAGAMPGQVAGWERPLAFGAAPSSPLGFARPPWFDAVAREVRNTVESASLFDMTTFGRIEVTGSGAGAFLDYVCPNRMQRPIGHAIYAQMLNARGGIESDITALRLSDEAWVLTVGTAALSRDLDWLRRWSGGFDVSIRDVSERYGALALMGPRSGDLIGDGAAREMRPFRWIDTSVEGIPVRAVSMSYVGASGWELVCDRADIATLWSHLVGAGAAPAGLYAQTAMRIEKRFLSHGHDIDADTTPLVAGLGRLVAWDKDFLGRGALERHREEGVANRIVSLVLDDVEAVPIGEEPVIVDGRILGKTTSAAFGHRIGRPVALALLSENAAPHDGKTVSVAIADRVCSARLIDGPAL